MTPNPKVAADVTVSNVGSLFLFTLYTDAARAWVEANVSEDRSMMGPSILAVEPRYAANLASGMTGDGLVVR